MADETKIPVKMPENVLPGVYANGLMIRHTHEEFVLDFINRFPPRGVVAARIIVSPGHLKRMIDALTSTLGHFRSVHGTTPQQPAAAPPVAPAAPATEAAAAPAQSAPPGAKTVKAQDVKTTIPDAVLAGVYANQMMISHTGEEFLLDFVSVFPPQGVVTARVFASPVQIRRMLAALRENSARYEAAHGTIVAANVPQSDSNYLN